MKKNKLFLLTFIIIFGILLGISIAVACDVLGVNLTAGISSSETTRNEEEVDSKQDTDEVVTEITEEETTTTTMLQEQQTIETSTDISTVVTAGIISPTTKQIALTFDSGWEYENTETLLNLLDEYGVKATFFTRGLWAKDHPDLAIEIVRRGHALENHSLTHGHMIEMTDEEVKSEISQTTDIISQTTGYSSSLFRPPYGEYDNRVLRILKEEGYPYTILWTVDSHDWAQELNGVKITKDYVVNRVLNNASNGGIILMHVGGYETVNALPEIITGLRSQGYDLVKVNDML